VVALRGAALAFEAVQESQFHLLARCMRAIARRLVELRSPLRCRA
jgi:hypothetical protein